MEIARSPPDFQIAGQVLFARGHPDADALVHDAVAASSMVRFRGGDAQVEQLVDDLAVAPPRALVLEHNLGDRHLYKSAILTNPLPGDCADTGRDRTRRAESSKTHIFPLRDLEQRGARVEGETRATADRQRAWRLIRGDQRQW